MSTHLITGVGTSAHVTSQNEAFRNASIWGTDTIVLPYKSRLSATLGTSSVTIGTGVGYADGMEFEVTVEEELTIAEGTSGLKRYDLICEHYEKASSGIESMYLRVIKGTAKTTPTDPTYSTGSVLDGDTSIDYPLYRVYINETSIDSVTALFSTPTTHNLHLKANQSALDATNKNVTSNATNIAANASNIATNKTNIATNAAAISKNATNIATNKTNIATNTTNIATNKTNIATNTTNIATNKTGIATNKTNIATNTTNIKKCIKSLNKAIFKYSHSVTLPAGMTAGPHITADYFVDLSDESKTLMDYLDDEGEGARHVVGIVRMDVSGSTLVSLRNFYVGYSVKSDWYTQLYYTNNTSKDITATVTIDIVTIRESY